MSNAHKVPSVGQFWSLPCHLRSLKAEPEVRISVQVIYWWAFMTEGEWGKQERMRSGCKDLSDDVVSAVDWLQADPTGTSGVWVVRHGWSHLMVIGTALCTAKSVGHWPYSPCKKATIKLRTVLQGRRRLDPSSQQSGMQIPAGKQDPDGSLTVRIHVWALS